MPKDQDFLNAAIKRIQLKKWEVMGAQIAERITILVRIPAPLIAQRQTAAEAALDAGQQLKADGWIVTGFNFSGGELLVDLARERFAE